MEIITMESKAYRHLIERIDNIAAYVRRHVIQEEKEKEAEVWLTSLQVCEILHISIRHLSRMRAKDAIPYALIGRKCLYRKSDVEALVRKKMSDHIPYLLSKLQTKTK